MVDETTSNEVTEETSVDETETGNEGGTESFTETQAETQAEVQVQVQVQVQTQTEAVAGTAEGHNQQGSGTSTVRRFVVNRDMNKEEFLSSFPSIANSRRTSDPSLYNLTRDYPSAMAIELIDSMQTAAAAAEAAANQDGGGTHGAGNAADPPLPPAISQRLENQAGNLVQETGRSAPNSEGHNDNNDGVDDPRDEEQYTMHKSTGR
jgi:hypothetical protein